MLANGAKLGYKKHGAAESTYTDLPGLKEIPEIGVEATLKQKASCCASRVT